MTLFTKNEVKFLIRHWNWVMFVYWITLIVGILFMGINIYTWIINGVPFSLVYE